VRRREFVVLGLATATLPAWAQTSPKRVRLGFLSNYSEQGGKELVGCFKTALAKLGWDEGQNVTFEHRWAEGKGDRYQPLAAELAAMDLDLIAVNSTPASQAMKKATAGKNMPVIFMSVSDPVESGLVASLRQPGGNMTGVSNFFPATAAKLLEIIKTIAPQLARAVVIRDPANPGKTLDVGEIKSAGRIASVEIIDGAVRNAEDIKRIIAESSAPLPGAWIVLVDGVTLSNKPLILDLIGQTRLPAIYQVREFVDGGGLVSYGLNFCQHFARAAVYVDKVLRGEHPADLPVELPTAFELVVNLKTAKELKLEIPPVLLARANEVIE
jgi:putative ABC transport system substrate-binding protein